uniref:Uncharacterized protein n=1 Tax=Setaria viridis TaxID=4556 RepID=A0A4U6UFA8_SETVI|nr:hypothetical protein SEVIR_5G186601v2 [Setaria viridis]
MSALEKSGVEALVAPAPTVPLASTAKRWPQVVAVEPVSYSWSPGARNNGFRTSIGQGAQASPGLCSAHQLFALLLHRVRTLSHQL